MAIDLITGHQGVAHISAEQIAELQRAELGGYGDNKVMRMIDGGVTYAGLTITVAAGYWRVNGFDMEVQEAEEILIDPTTTGLSRIDNIYVEILQDIPTGSQRSEIVTVQGEAAASPVAPDAPTAPVLNTDILLQVTPLATVTVTEGAMVMTDLSVAYEMVTPSELEAVEAIATGAQTTANTARTSATNALNMIKSTSSDAYSSSKAYSVGDHVIYNNKVYKCITACSAGSWATNRSCFTQTTLTSAVTDLNASLIHPINWNDTITTITAANTTYTMLVDGWIAGFIDSTAGHSAQVKINDNIVAYAFTSASGATAGQGIYIPVKAGDVIKSIEYGNYNLTIYGVS